MFYGKQRFVWIYGLIDPRTKSIRYVGATDNLNRRISTHFFYRFASVRRELWRRSSLNKWIDSLMAKKQFPLIKIFDRVWASCAADAEIKQIAKCRSRGEPLLNAIRFNPYMNRSKFRRAKAIKREWVKRELAIKRKNVMNLTLAELFQGA